ncbi:MAG: hypothetical protein WAQ25_02380 [Candidatus Saccharimonas sp.]
MAYRVGEAAESTRVGAACNQAADDQFDAETREIIQSVEAGAARYEVHAYIDRVWSRMSRAAQLKLLLDAGINPFEGVSYEKFPDPEAAARYKDGLMAEAMHG